MLASLARELAWNGLDLARASQLAETAVTTARRADDPATLASCLLAWHNVRWGPGNAAEAVATPLQGMDIRAAPKDRSWMAAAANAAELIAALDWRAGCEMLHEALAPYASSAVVIGAAVAFKGAVAHYLGLLDATMERTEEARAHFERALALHEGLGAHPWVLLSRYQLASLLLGDAATGDQARSTLAEIAEAAARLGMDELARRAETRGREVEVVPVARGVFRRDGALWTLGFAGRTVRMKDAKGLRDIAALLGVAGQPLHAAALVAVSGSGDSALAGLRLGADQVLDERARRQFRARLADLERRSTRPSAGPTLSAPSGLVTSGTCCCTSWPQPPGWVGGPGGSATSRSVPARRSPPASATPSPASSSCTQHWPRTCVPR